MSIFPLIKISNCVDYDCKKSKKGRIMDLPFFVYTLILHYQHIY